MIGLPVAAVILIDGQQVGATALPSNRLCLFTQAAVCPLCPPPGPRSPNLQSWREERDGNDATPPRGAASGKKKTLSIQNFSFFFLPAAEIIQRCGPQDVVRAPPRRRRGTCCTVYQHSSLTSPLFAAQSPGARINWIQ